MQAKCLDKPFMTGFDSLTTHKVAIADNEVTIDVFDSITKIPDQWDQLVEGKDCFLSRKFLQMMEEHPVEGIRPYYQMYTISGEVVGVAYLQHLNFNFFESFQEVNEEGTLRAKLENLRRRIFVWTGSQVKADPLICGSVFLTGEHGFCFNAQTRLKEEQLYDVIDAGMEKLSLSISSRPKIRVVKDLHPDRQKCESYYKNHGFARLPWLQPSMEMLLPEEWESFEHYLAAMLSKYRTRAKRAAKKAKSY